jgi:hypothetical protein
MPARPNGHARAARRRRQHVGTVVDISGAVIPGADVAVTSRDGRTSTVDRRSDGSFDAGVMRARARVVGRIRDRDRRDQRQRSGAESFCVP